MGREFAMYVHPNILREDDPLLATLEDYGFKHYPRQWFAHHGLTEHVFIDVDAPPTIEVETLDDLARIQERIQLPIQLDFESNTLTFISRTEDY